MSEPPVTLSDTRSKAARNPTAVVKHSLLIAGHPTSVSLEDAFWVCLKTVAAQRGMSVAALVAKIDAGRGEANLSSAIRVFLLEAALEQRQAADSQYRPAAEGSVGLPGD